MRARIRDTEIYFDIDGAALIPDGGRMRERPTAFLIHGGPGGDHAGLKAPYGKLAQKMQLVYFDQRGDGRSAACKPQQCTLDETVEDMEALRQYLGLGSIVSLGTSYGGMVAMAHAARYPKSVSHLILVITAAHSGFVERSREIVAERGTAEQIALCDDMYAGRLDTAQKLRRYLEVMAPLYIRKYMPDLPARDSETPLLSPAVFNHALGPGGFLRNFDLRPELAAVTAPTLILAGRHDWVCAPEFSEEIHRLIPGSDLRIFEESAHSIGSDENQELLDAVVGFMVYRPRASALPNP